MIEVICGPMFSGKSEELIRRLTRAHIAQKEVRAFKPQIDDRYKKTEIASHSGGSFPCIALDSAQMVEQLSGEAEVIGVDEVQFFKDLDFICHLSWTWGKHVIVAGLDMTFRREPFGQMGHLLAVADNVTKLSAVCHTCGNDAIYSQRLIDGKPAPLTGETVQVGGLDTYEARCANCFEIA